MVLAVHFASAAFRLEWYSQVWMLSTLTVVGVIRMTVYSPFQVGVSPWMVNFTHTEFPGWKGYTGSKVGTGKVS